MRARGTTLRRWALAAGYPPATVYAAVRRWAPRQDRTPQGVMTAEIMRALRGALGDDVFAPAPPSARPPRRRPPVPPAARRAA